MSLGGRTEITHHFWRLKNTELNEIFFFMSLRSFTLSLIIVFVPIYFLKLGLPIQDVFWYYIILHGGEFLLIYPTSFFIRRFGPKSSVLLSIPILIIHLLLLRAVGSYGISFFWAALSGSLVMAFFWQAYHLDFVLCKSASRASRQVATVAILCTILGALAPFVGGYLASHYGFGSVIILGCLLVTIGGVVFSIPIRNQKTKKINYDFNKINFSTIKNDLTANFGEGWDVIAAGVFWPLFIYLILGEYEQIGLVTSIGLLITVFLTLYVARRSDQGNRKMYIKYGDITSSVLDIVQSFVQNITHIYAINIFGSFPRSMRTAPYASEYYLRASENETGPYILLMEMAINIAKVSVLFILLFLSFYLPLKTVLIISFVFAAVGALMVTRMPSSKQDRIELRNRNIKMMPQPVKRLAQRAKSNVV